MIRKFLSEILKIPHDVNIMQHKTWKDNTTYEIFSGEESFIVQELSHMKSQKNQDFIELVIRTVEQEIPHICFADLIFKKRFYEFEGKQFQVMKKIPWKTLEPEDITPDFIQESARYLGHFHLWMSSFDTQTYSEMNEYKKMKIYRETAWTYITQTSDREIKEIYDTMVLFSQWLYENPLLPVGVIHGDPSFKNFLVDEENMICGLIDYDMLSVNTLLWDIADMIRGYLKIKIFDTKTFHKLLDSYTQLRPLTQWEQDNLKIYCQMMVLDTGFRYIISYFDNSNLLWRRKDCMMKAQRCTEEFMKLDVLFT